MMTYYKNIILFGIKSALISKKKNWEKWKFFDKSHSVKVTDFDNKEIPKVDSDYTFQQ